MKMLLFLFGLAPEVIKLIHELVTALKSKDSRKAILHAQRIIEVLEFELSHGKRPT